MSPVLFNRQDFTGWWSSCCSGITERNLITLSILLFVASSVGTLRLDACNSKISNTDVCVCDNDQVRCVGQPALVNVPRNIPQYTARLAIIQTSVTSIERADFAGLENLRVLFLQQNQIEFIDKFAFRNMYKLETLNLEQNRLAQLDPSGLMFQHLPSLSRLVLLDNKITTVNRYSFFTAVSNKHRLEVRMYDNQVQCDCNVLAMKNWITDVVPAGQISVTNLQCQNDGNKRTFDTIPASAALFGNCPGDLSNIFNTMFTCPDCEKESTNHACNLRPKITCTGLQMVCLRTVTWTESDRSLLISSRCERYSSCLDREARNPNLCGVGYQNTGDVKCEFCCMGPTCQTDTIGGRTYDLTYSLSYVNKNGGYQQYMNNVNSPRYQADMERITSGLKSTFQTVRAGIDVYLETRTANTVQTHSVALRIEITAMSFEAEDGIFNALEQDLGNSVQNSSSFLYQENIERSTIFLRRNGVNRSCDPSTTTSSKGTFQWGSQLAGSTQLLPCPYNNVNSGTTSYAKRTCLVSIGDWGPVDDEDCQASSTSTNPTDTTKPSGSNTLDDLNDIINTDVTPDNVLEVVTSLSEMTGSKSRGEISPEILNQVVSVLEESVQPDNLKQPGVANRVIRSLSNLMDIDFSVMKSGQQEDDTSSRIMTVIDTVAEKGPLDGGRLKVVTPNLAVAAQAISESESREVTLVANTNSLASEDLQNNQINVAFTDKSRQPAMDRTNLVLPVPALVKSLTTAERRQLQRAAFVVHRSDILFASMLQSEPDSGQPPSRTVSDGSNSGDNDASMSSSSEDLAETGRYVTTVNSMVLSASVPGVKVKDLSENVTLTFEHQAENATNPRCVFWDVASNDWSSEGCGIVTSSPGVTQCGCDHLTNFALLMDVYQEGTGLSSLDREILSFISYVGCGVSLAALLLTLATYALFRKLRRDNPSKILINLCLALLLSNLVYLIGMHDYSFDNSTACKVVAVLLHYSLLASLTWMAVEAFYMYLALILVFKTYFSNFILKCSLFGWGVPLLIVIATLAVDSTDNYGFINSGMCWLRNPAFYVAFVSPVCLILLVNCIAFALVIRQLSNMASSKLNKTDRNSTVQRLRGAIGIVILLGLTWIFAVFAVGEASVVFYYLFAIFNSLQGLFIFIFYCVLKKDAISAWKRLLPCFEEYGDSTKSSSNSRGVSQSGTNMNAVNTKYRVPSAPHLHDSHSTSTTSTSMISDSRKDSVTTILGISNVYHTIDDTDIYTNLEYGTESPVTSDPQRPPSYSAAGGSHVVQQQQGIDNPAMERFPYIDDLPTAYSYRNGNVSPNNGHFSPGGQISRGMQPFGPAFSYSDRQNEQNQHQIPRPRAEGEFDSSDMAKVRDIRLRYERTTSQTSDYRKTNI